MSPYYFPDVVRNADGSLTGYFDYRPKDADEAITVARSTDDGKTWTSEGEALEENAGYCPTADATDNGQGHPFVMASMGPPTLYTLQRPAGDYKASGCSSTTSAHCRDPLAALPSATSVGIDPNTFASAEVEVPRAAKASASRCRRSAAKVPPSTSSRGPTRTLDAPRPRRRSSPAGKPAPRPPAALTQLHGGRVERSPSTRATTSSRSLPPSTRKAGIENDRKARHVHRAGGPQQTKQRRRPRRTLKFRTATPASRRSRRSSSTTTRPTASTSTATPSLHAVQRQPHHEARGLHDHQAARR